MVVIFTIRRCDRWLRSPVKLNIERWIKPVIFAKIKSKFSTLAVIVKKISKLPTFFEILSSLIGKDC